MTEYIAWLNRQMVLAALMPLPMISGGEPLSQLERYLLQMKYYGYIR